MPPISRTRRSRSPRPRCPSSSVRYGLARDTGGAGRWRGGLATADGVPGLRARTAASPRATATARCFRPGASWAARPAAARPTWSVNPGQPDERRARQHRHLRPPSPATSCASVSPGGGGRGDPLDREPERVLRDVRAATSPPRTPAAEYGVVLPDGEVDLAVDRRDRGAARRAPPQRAARTSTSARSATAYERAVDAGGLRPR